MESVQAQFFDRVENGRMIQGRRFTLLGDGIFRHNGGGNTCIKSYHHQPNNINLPEWQMNENRLYRSIRQHIEHWYGSIESTFSLCSNKKNFKLRGNRSIAKEQLGLTHFLFNCYTCDNGNSTSNRFGCLPPTLQEYLRLE